MISKHNTLGIVLVAGLASLGLGACSSSTDGNAGTGGATPAGVAGAVNAAGSHSSAGNTASGGSPSVAGAPGVAGAFAAAGSSPVGGGGTSSAAGASSGGASVGGTSSGGTSSGGTSSGGAGGKGGGAGNGAGGMSTGTCQKGQIKPAEVVIMGESFYAIAPQYIQNRIQDDARKAGSLGASDTYRNVAVSGQNMNYIATTEWTAATQGNASVKFVIMDGGGIDCLSGSSCPTCGSTFKTLLGKMATAGVQDVIYTRYPEPGAPPGSNASLKACLDATMPTMQTTCEGSTSPRCHFVDLRPVWKDGDTTDGLHPTTSGGEHVGDLLWSEMVKGCFAQ